MYKYDNSGGERVPVGTQCYECSCATQKGWPELSWQQMLMKVKVSKSFAKSVGDVVRRWRKSSATATNNHQGFTPQNLDVEQLEGYVLERILQFVSESEFLDTYGVAMKDVPELKPHVQELLEHGKPVRGIAIRHPEHPHRLLRLYGSFQTCLSENIHDSNQQLRESQGQEALSHFRTVRSKQTHQSLRSDSGTLPDLAAIVQKFKERRQEPQPVRPPSPIRQTWGQGEDAGQPASRQGQGLIDLDSETEQTQASARTAYAGTLVGLQVERKKKSKGSPKKTSRQQRVTFKRPMRGLDTVEDDIRSPPRSVASLGNGAPGQSTSTIGQSEITPDDSVSQVPSSKRIKLGSMASSVSASMKGNSKALPPRERQRECNKPNHPNSTAFLAESSGQFL